MSALESRSSIAKLSNSNYHTWKFKAEMVLIRDDLWDVITNDIPTSQDANWLKKNNQARAAIGLMVEDNQLTNIRQHVYARDVWNALKGVHERSNLCSKLFLLRKLYKRRLTSDITMRDHINSTLEIVDQLRALGEDMKDSHTVALFLCSLPESYSTLITALETRPESELSLEFVKGKLLDEYDRRREHESANTGSEEKLLSATQRNFKSNRESRTCYFCHKTGHLKKNCRMLKQRSNVHKVKAATEPTSGNSDAITQNSNSAGTNEEYYCFGLREKQGIQGWYVDSGATSHMTSDKLFFKEFKEFVEPINIFLADGGIAKAHGSGNGILKCEISTGNCSSVELRNVLFVPGLDGSLLSVKTLTLLGYTLSFEKEFCKIMYNDKIVAIAKLDPLLYKLNVFISPELAQIAQESQHIECIHLWHRRMGHRNPSTIERLSKDNLVTGMRIQKCDNYSKCIGCLKGKTTRKPFPKASLNRATEPFQLAHSDVCGPMKTPTHQGKRYMLTIIDDFSRYTEVYLLKHKNEAELKIKEYVAMGRNKFQRVLQTLRTDGGGEFFSANLDNFLRENGIRRQVTVPHSPQQNGVAERKNRSLIETARCMLFDAKLSNNLWGEAVVTANYLQNRSIHKQCNQTPYQLWNNTIPDVRHIRVFGSEAHVFVPKESRSKFDSTTQEGILLGYSSCAKGYRIMLKGSNKIVISRTVKFYEGTGDYSLIPKAENHSNEDKNPENDNLVVPITPDQNINNPEIDAIVEIEHKKEPEVIVRSSARPNKGIPAARYGYKAVIYPEREPEDWNEMMSLPAAIRNKWIEATDEEIKILNLNKTWELTDLPVNKSSIDSKWVFKMKTSPNQEPIYRARLVAKGYQQKPGEDYDTIFAPVAHYTTVRTLLALTAKTGLKTRHLDAKAAFLQGEIDEELYMNQPAGYIQSGGEHYVCKLRKSIYGLKQSACVWNRRINDIFLKLGFNRGEADNCLYTKVNNGSRIFVLLYVDDILVCADTETSIEEIKEELQKVLNIKDLGEVSSYLGIHVKQNDKGDITIDQEDKIEKLLIKYGMTESKEAAIPMETNFLKILNLEETPSNDNFNFRELIGSLLYLANTSRPDISTATGILARRVENPSTTDVTAAKRILRYLKKTKGKKIIYKNSSNLNLTAYADADWAGEAKDRKSTSGQVFLLGDSLIAWSSRKQSCISLSSTEAEFVSAAYAAQEAIWIKRLLNDFGQVIKTPITLFEDNQGCIKLAISDKNSARTKHMDVRLQFLKELQSEGTIALVYCPTENMLADLFTKPLPAPKFNEILTNLRMLDNAC